jgi:hypothetical protein
MFIAAVAGLLLAGPAMAIPALASTTAPAAKTSDAPPPAQRIAATTATYDAIEAKIAAGKPISLRYPDPTAAYDILDYGVNDLWKKGIDGAGVTVAYIVTNPDPNLAASMTKYDADMHLPPADITQMTIPGASNPNFTCQVECSTGEDELDAEAIHSMAPYAKIIFVHPSVPETIGMQGWPQIAQAIKTIADEHLANAITVSMGDGENDFINDPTNPGATQQAAIHSLDPAFLDAAAKGIPVDFSSGDCGPTDPTVLNDTGQCTPTTGVSADHPSDNPWVTSVGGTIPNAGLGTTTGRTAPDGLWAAPNGNSDAASAGVSAVYGKPWWQNGIPALAHVKGRALPDISMDANDGTSQASPTFTGILALATQVKHGDLGTVNPALAALGPKGAAAGIIDVPAGYTDTAYGVTGYSTGPGYDIASGWGTIYAPTFVPALVRKVGEQHGYPAQVARAELDQLQSDVSVSARAVRGGQTVTVTGRGFVAGSTPNGTSVVDGFGVYPGLPGQYGVSGPPYADPTSTVPGETWDDVAATLTGPGTRAQQVTVSGPDGNGVVKAAIDTTGLRPGRYAVTITGRLLTQTATFIIR